MQDPSETQPRKRSTFTDSPGRWWKNVAIPALPVVACFLGGATQKWSEGIIVALFGLILLAHPPRHSLGPVLNGILLALIASAAIAFLPARWFMQPEWRMALTNDFALQLPNTLSPQPWITLGCFLSFLAGLSWLYYMSALELDLREVRQQLRFFAIGVVLLAALSIALHRAHTALPFWHNERGFGPFPNRNQTANLFGLTAIVIMACGQEDIRQGRKRWVLWLVGLAIIVTGIVLDFSRAGVLILVAGSALWLGVFVLRKGSAARIALGLSILLILLTVMLVFGGQTFERFHLRDASAPGMSADLRWAIFRDVLQLIRASPWCGIGLGNFDEVFAVFRDASLNEARAIHPDSDWFWLWAELGWPAVIGVIAGIALFIRRVFPLQEGTNQRFRVAALIAAILFVLHGVIDVSGHRMGTAFAGIFLLGLALRRPAQWRPSFWAPHGFRILGVVFLVVGLSWLAATRYDKPLPGAVGVENEMRLASAANRGRNFNETIERTTRALGWAPLKWQLYFLRALAKVGAKQPPENALEDFRRARFLEPNSFEVPFEEGRVWLTSRPSLTINAWREALRRSGARQAERYDYMLSLAAQYNPPVVRTLEELGSTQHDLILVYLARASGTSFMRALHRFLEREPDLQTLSANEREKFFSLWTERGEAAELDHAVEIHPDWLKYSWRGIAKARVRKNDFRSAFEIVRKFGEPPQLPSSASDTSIDQLRQSLHANPDNYGIGFQLYTAQMHQSQIDEALVTVRHFTERDDCPRYFHFLEAEAWAAKENWERAWKSWEKFQPTKNQ